MKASSAAIVQGIYFTVTGIWPIISIGTFQMVTGRKTDLWLVRTVGITVAAIGAGLICAGLTGELCSAVFVTAIGSAAGLAGIDLTYTLKRVIAPVYLLDAVVEIMLILWWLLILTR